MISVLFPLKNLVTLKLENSTLYPFSEEAFWIDIEIFSIPWRDELRDLTSQRFLDAKYLVEKGVSVNNIASDIQKFTKLHFIHFQFDEELIENEWFWGKKYVRTVAMEFIKGICKAWIYYLHDAKSLKCKAFIQTFIFCRGYQFNSALRRYHNRLQSSV